MTFIAELAGTVILSPIFYSIGDTFGSAVWRGLFTAISAFCNAGFSLQSDSLILYQNNPAILFTVSALIVIGGLAPATSLLFPRWIRCRKTPIQAQLAFIMTLVLLTSGTLFILAFEWDGVLAGLTLGEKIVNAWFQSVTLRTAGFNSVDISHVANPTFLVMLCFMFIGGSPGGTAGGVKTTTIGVLALTFWSNITSRGGVVMKNRKIASVTIYRAVTIVMSGLLMWIVAVIMLEVTQRIPANDIIFETASAIGTVGLSTGATTMLDEIGKIIIMVTMFVGRIGPTALYLLISENAPSSLSHWPETKITLT
jgi:trk system potassium uptake protein TrkH